MTGCGGRRGAEWEGWIGGRGFLLVHGPDRIGGRGRRRPFAGGTGIPRLRSRKQEKWESSWEALSVVWTAVSPIADGARTATSGHSRFKFASPYVTIQPLQQNIANRQPVRGREPPGSLNHRRQPHTPQPAPRALPHQTPVSRVCARRAPARLGRAASASFSFLSAPRGQFLPDTRMEQSIPAQRSTWGYQHVQV